MKKELIDYFRINRKTILFSLAFCVVIGLVYLMIAFGNRYYHNILLEKQTKIEELLETIKEKELEYAEESSKDGRGDVLGKIKQCAEFVTTEIYVKQVANIMIQKDTISIWRPDTWSTKNLGERRILMPVNVTIKYGFDLSNLTIDNVKIDEKNSQVWIYLPDPQVLGTDYDPHLDYKSIITICTNKFAPTPSTEELTKAYHDEVDYIIKTFDNKEHNKDVYQNAKNVFEAMLQKIGYKNTEIVLTNDNLKIKQHE